MKWAVGCRSAAGKGYLPSDSGSTKQHCEMPSRLVGDGCCTQAGASRGAAPARTQATAICLWPNLLSWHP